MASTWLTHLEHQWRSLAWRPWLDAFREFTVLRHDSRGCGLSDRDTDKLSFENWVSDLACVADAVHCVWYALHRRHRGQHHNPARRQTWVHNVSIMM